MGLILTFFFGPLGILYSTVMGAIVMFFVCLLGVGITIATMGMGILFHRAYMAATAPVDMAGDTRTQQ